MQKVIYYAKFVEINIKESFKRLFQFKFCSCKHKRVLIQTVMPVHANMYNVYVIIPLLLLVYGSKPATYLYSNIFVSILINLLVIICFANLHLDSIPHGILGYCGFHLYCKTEPFSTVIQSSQSINNRELQLIFLRN